ncbi:hypothetical protein NMG60_11023456 [Bertholletia excelsa]
MGNWNRRWFPRKKYLRETPQSSYRLYHAEPESSGIWQNSVPSWEKDFCSTVGAVPWQKVVVAKRYMYCHDNVVKTFWASINGIPCDIVLPDPNLYIDEIDWNPDIDPELILELDCEYFNPDIKAKVKKVDAANQKSLRPDVEWRGNLNDGGDQSKSSDLKDVALNLNHGASSTNDMLNLDSIEDPWERSYNQGNGASKENTWANCRDKSWDWNHGITCNEQSKDFCNPWDHGNQIAVTSKEKGWGDVGNNMGWNCWETNARKSRKFDSSDTPWGCTLKQVNDGGRYRGRGNAGDKNRVSEQWGNLNRTQKHFNSKRNSEFLGNLNGRCWKKEDSHQYSSRYKSLRYQDGDYGTEHQWSKKGIQKRVNFA